tara:strand:- start:482 stop:817 length:336 start_codon:yes stop_codon:yes gene_type:complete
MDKPHKDEINLSWQTQLEKEKQDAAKNSKDYHQPSFSVFLSSLSMQAMIAMGKVENPLTGKADPNFDQARFLIDTLEIIKGKTTGNLTKEEETLLDDYLYNLRMMYIELKK